MGQHERPGTFPKSIIYTSSIRSAGKRTEYYIVPATISLEQKTSQIQKNSRRFQTKECQMQTNYISPPAFLCV